MDMITLAMAKAYTNSQRLAYVEKKTDKIEVFPQTTLEFPESKRVDVDYLTEIYRAGDVTVVFDGVEYHCEVRSGLRFGNEYLFTGMPFEDTGEPFYYNMFEGIESCFMVSTPGTHTIEVYHTKEVEIIHPIDMKYMPEGGVGYTEKKKGEVIFPQTTIEADFNGDYLVPFPTIPLTVGKEYTVVFDGELFKCIATGDDETQYLHVAPFSFEHWAGLHYRFSTMTPGNHTVEIYAEEEVVVPIEQKYIPAMDSLTINGTDGKQYKLTVENGALSVTAV